MPYQTTHLPPTVFPTAPLDALTDLRQIDEAVDYAARVCKATVGEFLAAPLAHQAGAERRELCDHSAAPDRPTYVAPPGQIELAVEFLVPPASAEQFADELDRALIRRSLGYFGARRSGLASAARVVALPPGAFHQWRSAWNVPPAAQHARRWSTDRRFLDGILIQAQIGWREIFAIA
jgi:hypothetical protein